MKCLPDIAPFRVRTALMASRFQRGFTLLEVMISMVILSIALTVAWQTFSAATRAWTVGREVLDKEHHGDFVLTQLSSALRSTAVFDSAPEKYGFRMESNRSGYGDHTISWVTASNAFIPPGEVFAHGLHRLQIGGGEDDDGNEGLVVSAWNHLADEDEVEKKSWFISENIKGLSCQAYDEEKEDWTDNWERSNAIPGLIEITLYTDPVKEGDNPITFRQLIEIPVGPMIEDEIPEVR